MGNDFWKTDHQFYIQDDPRVVIGKKYTNNNDNYGSVSIDELMFWKVELSEEELKLLV